MQYLFFEICHVWNDIILTQLFSPPYFCLCLCLHLGPSFYIQTDSCLEQSQPNVISFFFKVY